MYAKCMERKTQFCATTRPIMNGSCLSMIPENNHVYTGKEKLDSSAFINR